MPLLHRSLRKANALATQAPTVPSTSRNQSFLSVPARVLPTTPPPAIHIAPSRTKRIPSPGTDPLHIQLVHGSHHRNGGLPKIHHEQEASSNDNVAWQLSLHRSYQNLSRLFQNDRQELGQFRNQLEAIIERAKDLREKEPSTTTRSSWPITPNRSSTTSLPASYAKRLQTSSRKSTLSPQNNAPLPLKEHLAFYHQCLTLSRYLQPDGIPNEPGLPPSPISERNRVDSHWDKDLQEPKCDSASHIWYLSYQPRLEFAGYKC